MFVPNGDIINHMFVTTIEVRDRPKNGTRAFTDEEEAELYRLHKDEQVQLVELAAYFKVSFNTIRNVISRHEKLAKELGAA